MAFGGFHGASGANRATPEINMVPLIDVMLVLLVIFMITAPLLTHQVKIDLPKAGDHPNQEKTESVALSIDAAGQYFWNSEPVDQSVLRQRLAEAAARQPQPELHLRVDKATAYQLIAEVLTEAADSGITRIGFVSEPNEHKP